MSTNTEKNLPATMPQTDDNSNESEMLLAAGRFDNEDGIMTEMIDKAKLLEYLAAIKPDEYVSAYGEAAVDVINHIEKYVSEMSTIKMECGDNAD